MELEWIQGFSNRTSRPDEKFFRAVKRKSLLSLLLSCKVDAMLLLAHREHYILHL
jgi:hypothetical protein